MKKLTCKDRFSLPDGIIYLDGNSLGPLPNGAADRAHSVITQQWGQQLIGAWTQSDWINLPKRVGNRLAPLLGAAPNTITLGDTLSIKVYQALDAALKLRPDRRVILTDSGNFPTDLYMAQGLIDSLNQGHELRIVEPDAIEAAITADVAAVMLTQVDYRTGRLHDMAAITARAQAQGAITTWDLAHSAGAVPVDVLRCNAEFAVGCTYKFLNGGPGAPAFIYVRPDLIEHITPALAGWMGHAAPFEMAPTYRPAPGIDRLRVGTPPVLQMAVLEAALDVWDGVNMDDVRNASIALSELFIGEVERTCPQLALASPRNPHQRGSQVSFAFEDAYPAIRALIERGVIGDFRAPNFMRFGFTPLYLDADDIYAAAEHLAVVMQEELWRDPRFQTKGQVT